MKKISQRKAICIVGMHRSGTSMVANVLQKSGLDLGPEDQFIPAMAENPQGFFEQQAIVDLNDELLAHFSGSWYAPPEFPENWAQDVALQPLKEKALQIIEPFQDTKTWGWKDPRNALLLPFWQNIIPNLTVVICVRNPLDVAKSLEKRNNIDIAAGGYLWERYTLAAIENSASLPRMVTFYEDFFGEKAAEEIRRLQTFCGLPDEAVTSAKKNTIDRQLQHHRNDIIETISSRNLPPENAALYLAFRALAEKSAEEDRWNTILSFAEHFRQSESALVALLREKTGKMEQMSQDFNSQLLGLIDGFNHQQKLLGVNETLIAHQKAEIQKQNEQLEKEKTASEQFIDGLKGELADFQIAMEMQEVKLKEVVAEKDQMINEMRASITKGDQLAVRLRKEIEKRGTVLEEQWGTLSDKDSNIAAMHHQMDSLNSELAALRNSFSWRLTGPLRFGYNVLAFLIGPRTWLARFQSIAAVLRRFSAEIQRTSFRDFLGVRWFYFKHHGPLGYFRNAYQELHNFTPPTSPKTPPLVSQNGSVSTNGGNKQLRRNVVRNRKPISLEVTPVYQDVTVSVVIPVKNAGNEFRFMLSLLKNQQGFREVEIVVVDSGSSDGSVEIAKSFGGKVIEIEPEDFSHSYARNLGAENASGEYVLFTVQDAMPPSKTWLYELFRSLKKGEIVAASCAEFPREDADLFYRILSWNHYRFMEVNERDRVMSLPETENYITLRKNAQVSDIANLVERDVFMKYRYRNDYAEDLDLGLRLIRDGYKLSLLGSTRVIHSHNRSPYYHIRRGFVDKTIIASILPDEPSTLREANYLFRDILFGFRVLDKIVHEELRKIALPASPQVVFDCVRENIKQAIRKGDLPGYGPSENEYLDEKFSAFLKNLEMKVSAANGNPQKVKNSLVLNSMNGFLGMSFEYMTNIYEQIDETVLEEFSGCLYKIGAFLCGIHLGTSYLSSSEKSKSSIEMLHSELTAGV